MSSGAHDPKSTGYFTGAVIAARAVIEDSGLLSQADGDRLAEAVAERLLGDFLAEAEAASRPVFSMTGTGPFCSWCARIPGPELPAGHFQRGVFCECKRTDEYGDHEEENAA